MRRGWPPRRPCCESTTSAARWFPALPSAGHRPPIGCWPSLSAEAARGIDLKTTTEDDFPGFLGKNRDLRVDHIALERDWSQHPPRLLWKQPIGAGWSGFAAVNGFACTLEQRGDQELVSCYNARDWPARLDPWPPSPAQHDDGGRWDREARPTIHEGRVFTLGATGTLQCLDGSTGRLLWSDDLLKRYGIDPAKEAEAIGMGPRRISAHRR